MNKQKLQRKINAWLEELEKTGVSKRILISLIVLAFFLPLTAPVWFRPRAMNVSMGGQPMLTLTPTITPETTEKPAPTKTVIPTRSSKQKITKTTATPRPTIRPTKEPTGEPTSAPEPTDEPTETPSTTNTPVPTAART